MTSKGAATRQRIVEGAAVELRRRGPGVSLDEIREATRTSKSQLFHYFPDGRAQLLLAVARHEADQVLADQQPHLGDLSSWDSWTAWRDQVIERYRRQGRHCPLSSLLAQLAPNDEGGRTVVLDLYARWEHALAEGVRRMQAGGRMTAAPPPAQAAQALLVAVQGGVVVLMATGVAEHLETALDLTLANLRTP
ncbi:TetR/AcrR family transcriptional regulator [Acrocarpospora corrugata]|nr:TetR/AcrR family transcriptional regulator [Acrocarpospora corrugata]